MAQSKRNREKLRRRQARAAHRDALNVARPERPPRTFFLAKARKGDTARIAFTFSGLPVPFNPEAENPAAGLFEETARVNHLASSSLRSVH